MHSNITQKIVLDNAPKITILLLEDPMNGKVEVTELSVKDFIGIALNQERRDAIPRLLERLKDKFRVPIAPYSPVSVDPIPRLTSLVKNLFEQLGKLGLLSVTIGKSRPRTIELAITKSAVNDA